MAIHLCKTSTPSTRNGAVDSQVKSNLFFPEFMILYNTYKIQPWGIRNQIIYLFIFNFNINENVNKHKSIIGNQKRDIFILSNEKQSINISHRFTNYVTIGGSLCTCCLERGGLNDYSFAETKSKNFGR